MANLTSSVESFVGAPIGLDVEISNLQAYEAAGAVHPSTIVPANTPFSVAVEIEFGGPAAAMSMGPATQFNVEYFFESIGGAPEPPANAPYRLPNTFTVAGQVFYSRNTAAATTVSIPANSLLAGSVYRVAAIVNILNAGATTIFAGYIEGLIIQAR